MKYTHLLAAWIIVALLCPSPVRAGVAVELEAADTGLALVNSAPEQERHYIGSDTALAARLQQLMADTDILLAGLRALPPELDHHELTASPAAPGLAALVHSALESHPRLTQQRAQLAVDTALSVAATSQPDPMLMLNVANVPLPTMELGDTPMTQVVLGFSQQFISYGKTGIKREIANREEALALTAVQQLEFELAGQVTAAYYDVVRTAARLAVLDDAEQLLALLVELAESKYAAGATAQAQVISAQQMLTQVIERRANLASLHASQLAELDGLLGVPGSGHAATFDYALAFPELSPVDIDTAGIAAAAEELRPDFIRIEQLLEQHELKLEAAERAYYPDYTLSASYGFRPGKRDFFSLGVSIPVFTHKRVNQDADLQAAYASREVTAAEREVLTNELVTQLSLAVIELDRLVEIGALYRDALVPQARLALESAAAAYAANRGDLATLLAAQQELLSLELELKLMNIDYLAQLSRLQLLSAGAFDPAPYLTSSATVKQTNSGSGNDD